MTNVVEKLIAARSVDFVTEPGAGGRVELYEADESDADFDIDLVDVEAFRERRPDIVTAIEDAVRETTTKEVTSTMEDKDRIKELEDQLKETNEKLTKATTDLTEATDKLATAEKAQKVAEAQIRIKEAVNASGLPDTSKTRLLERYKDADTDEKIAEAIKDEADYLEKLGVKLTAPKATVKGLGESEKKDVTEDDLAESFQFLGLDEGQSKTAAHGR